MLTIDGAQGEGGGQILRTALSLSICLGRPFRMVNIRANRHRPGLQPQHLAAVRAAARVAQAEVAGAERDSQSLYFTPAHATAGDYHFDIGTAGSTVLVLQTILPALLLVTEPSTILLEGGTHIPLAPPFEFLQYAFMPALNRTGGQIAATLERPGFMPRGGGRLRVQVKPVGRIEPLVLNERGRIVRMSAHVLLANLPGHIAERELAVIRQRLALAPQNLHYSLANDAQDAGNLVAIVVQCENITECFTALGKKGLPAERVAELAVTAAQHYLDAQVAVGSHLADQLLLYLALAGGGQLLTLPPSSHTLTNISVIEAFTGVPFTVRESGPLQYEIRYAG